MKTSRTKTYKKKSWQKRAFSILTLVFLLVQTVLSPVAQYVSAENTNVALSFNQTEALEGDTLTATLSDIGEDSGKLTFTVDGGLSIKGIADGQGNIDIVAQQDKTLSFTWKEGSSKTLKVNVAANEKGSSTATLTSENGGTSSVAIQITAQEEVVSEEATEPEEEVAAASEESTVKATEEQTTESENQTDSEKAADETAGSNEEAEDESSSKAAAQSDDSSSESLNASARAGMKPDERYYNEKDEFGYDSMTEGGTVTGATVSVNGTTLTKGEHSSTTGEAVENGILITFTPGYYLHSYKVVCGDKYGCQTDASGNAISKAEVMEGATVASIMLDSDDGITKTAFGHSSRKDPYWLLLDVRQDNTKYKVTYNWGDLEGKINTDVPAEKSYLVSSVVTVEAAADAALAEAEALGYTFAGWKYTYEGYDGVTTMQPNQTFSMPNKNVTMTAIWEEIPVGTLTVTKEVADVESDDNSATFNFIILDENDKQVANESISYPEKKSLSIEKLPVGKYTVLEKDPSGAYTEAGYKYEGTTAVVGQSSATVTSETKDDIKYVKVADVSVTKDGTNVTFTNTYKKNDGSIKVVKIDELTKKPLEGVEFTLYLKGDKEDQKISSDTTDSKGEVTFANLEYGTYRIEETKVPEGYAKQEIEDVIVNSNKAITCEVTNTGVGSVKINKTDDLTGNTLAGVKFGIYTKGGDLVKEVITGEGGTVTLSGLAYGEYYAQETQGLAGYKTDDTKHDFTIASGEGKAEVTLQIKNKGVGSVTIKKTDDLTGAALKGVKFGIYTEGGDLVKEVITGEGGTVTLSGLAYGEYYAQETQGLAGYKTDDTKHDFTIASGEGNA
ncbi:MSCRAMM family protein, partial [Bacillus sp. FJAT-27916]|uniref:MSCRAMM family protein n=1 Tax=Bacillus sp. FJAT-27916 TaxID=1679169 RepID=UPI0022B1992D